MRTNKRRAFAGVCAAFLGAAVVVWAIRDEPSTEGQAESLEREEQPDQAGSPQALDIPAIESPRRVAVAALPPLDAPLADVLDEMLRRASNGDAQAACRVAAEVEHCSPYLGGQSLEAIEEGFVRGVAGQDLSGRELEAAVAQLSQMTDRIRRERERCRDVPRERISPMMPHYLRAAQLGDPVAAARYVRFMEAENPSLLIARPDLAEAYRQWAFPLFQSQLQAGNRDMAGLWRAATDPRSRFAFSGVLPPEWKDPDLAYALAGQIRGMSKPPEHNERMASMSAAVLDEARRLHQIWFTGATADQTRDLMRGDPRMRCERL